MKKTLFITSLSIIITLQINAQSNTFPPTGNVGIGTTTPNEKLQIGNAFSFHDGGHEVIGFKYAASGGKDLDSNNYAAEIRFDGVSGNLGLGTSSSITSVPSSRLIINKDGNVGIGTSDPKEKFHVEGNLLIDTYSLGNDNGIYFRENFSSGNKYNLSILTYDHSNSGASPDGLSFNAYDGLSFSTGSNTRNERMRIDINGNVGIGTTTPDSKLTVKGQIHTSEVKVDLASNVAPDYVFYNDYDLKTLTEVEDYISTEGHLPNIPSAKEMETNGLLLKEMNLKLLEKIEELTLYTIQQEKKLEKVKLLEKELQNQKIINKTLEEKLNTQITRIQNIEKLLNSKKQ